MASVTVAAVLEEPRGLWLLKGPSDDPENCSFTAPRVDVEEEHLTVKQATDAGRHIAQTVLFEHLPTEATARKAAVISTSAGRVAVFVIRSPNPVQARLGTNLQLVKTVDIWPDDVV